MNKKQLTQIVGCVIVNLTLATIAVALSLPVYLDSVGTIISVAILPWYLAVTVAIGTSCIGAMVINPDLLAYCGTQLIIVLVAFFCFKAGMLKSWKESLLSGILIAVSAVIVSAPVTVLLFGGITWSETDILTSILLASGKSIWQSVLQGAIFIESIDKPFASLLAWFLLKKVKSEWLGADNIHT